MAAPSPPEEESDRPSPLLVTMDTNVLDVETCSSTY
jgi:hypothetical protein